MAKSSNWNVPRPVAQSRGFDTMKKLELRSLVYMSLNSALRACALPLESEKYGLPRVTQTPRVSGPRPAAPVPPRQSQALSRSWGEAAFFSRPRYCLLDLLLSPPNSVTFIIRWLP